MSGWRGGWIVRWGCHEKEKYVTWYLFQGSSPLSLSFHYFLVLSLSVTWCLIQFEVPPQIIFFFTSPNLLSTPVLYHDRVSVFPSLDGLEKSGLELQKSKGNRSEKPVLKNRSPIRTSRKNTVGRSSGPRLALPGGRWEYFWDFQLVGWYMSENGNLWTYIQPMNSNLSGGLQPMNLFWPMLTNKNNFSNEILWSFFLGLSSEALERIGSRLTNLLFYILTFCLLRG